MSMSTAGPGKRKAFVAAIALLAALGGAVATEYDDFFTAITRDNARNVETIVRQGFDPNARDPAGQTGLYLALRDESLKAADVLIRVANLDVNLRNAVGETPLMMAALRGQVAQAKALLLRGAHVNLPGWTPLHYAASGPRTELVALLLDNGAAIDAESPNRSTPLMMASRYSPEASVDLLLARGADATRRNDQGLTASDFARLGGRESLATRLAPLTRK